MKLLKSVFATAALAALATTAAQAATTIRLTGSTAYRTSVTTAIENIMGGSGNFEAVYRDSDGTSELNAKASIFKGNITGANNPVTIKCFWSGSVGGVKTVAQSLTLASSWIADAEITGTNGVTHKTSPAYDGALTADVTMSDSRQAATQYTGGVNLALTATQVGIVPFVWIKNNGAPSGLSNMTALLVRAVYGNPLGAPLAQFTGNSADTALIYGVGRDQDSGTRIGAFAESGFGTLTTPSQYILNGTGSMTSAQSYPANTLLGTTFAVGSSGYGSGGNVATAMNLTGSSTAPVYDETDPDNPHTQLSSGGYYVAYVGTSDAKSLTGHSQDGTTGIFSSTGALQVMTYNGIQYSYANVREGLYTFWTKEFIMWRSTLSTDGKFVGTALKNEVLNNTANLAGIKISTMNCDRSLEGGVVGHN